ncbi:putative MFS family arabinose efflux permease [Blastococcus saxobsidens]|uniref:Putative MFS family arabinose efflux permease n=1 Tax=Blastococcus saxobsidens TaxID=138336 RepID=A0A4Q7Y1K7_9ACTN|nr:putative MFS family arabinose efflux permease [Blastococcus saxobsidens]
MLWRSCGVLALVGVTALGFASYCLTLASLPTYAVTGGASESTAGVVTAVLLTVTMAVQVVVPALTTRFGAGPVLAAGLLALGLPAPFYALDDGVGWICALSVVRGAGFGVLTVLGATLATRVAPSERRGEALGVYGLAIAVPNMLAVPAGVALVLGGQVGWLSWLAASPLLGLVFLPVLMRSVRAGEGMATAGRAGAAVRAAVAPSAVLFVVTTAGGGLVTFLPIDRPDGRLATVALLLWGLTGAVTRWRAGVLADRLGTALLLPVALMVAAVGVGLTGVGLWTGSAWVLLGSALFGAGYGAVQNLTLLRAFARAGEGGTTAASATWNASFDLGTASGALLLGVAFGTVGLSWTFVLVAAVLAAALPLARISARSVPVRA